jgi:hypothetical protein
MTAKGLGDLILLDLVLARGGRTASSGAAPASEPPEGSVLTIAEQIGQLPIGDTL